MFDATHGLLLELVRAGHIDGFRIDHPDGLADPRQYFARLARATGGAWVVAEKILEADEQIPPDWQVAGTTGYDALWRVQSLFVDPAGDRPLGALMEKLTGDVRGDLPGMVTQAKREIVATLLQAEVERLTSLLADICRRRRAAARAHPARRCRSAWWRCSWNSTAIGPTSSRARRRAGPARTSWPPLPSGPGPCWILDGTTHCRWSWTCSWAGRWASPGGRGRNRPSSIVRFQQVTGAVMAKGVEDTAFYRWTHLVSLCEVGGAPQRFAITPDELHAWAQYASSSIPATMTAGSTHDTKRGEDVRARLGVVSQYAEEWVELVGRLQQLTAERRPAGLDGRAENLLWQTVAGTWTEDGPIGAGRLAAYLVKASREAKTWTSWRAPDRAAEEALTGFATHLVTDPEVAGGLRRVGRPHGPRRAGRRPGDQAGAADAPGCGRRVPGHRVAGDRPRRPRQPRPSRCERPCRAVAPDGCRGGRARVWPTRSSRSPPLRCACAGRSPAPSSARAPATCPCPPPPATLWRSPGPRSASPGRSPSSVGSPPP